MVCKPGGKRAAKKRTFTTTSSQNAPAAAAWGYPTSRRTACSQISRGLRHNLQQATDETTSIRRLVAPGLLVPSMPTQICTSWVPLGGHLWSVVYGNATARHDFPLGERAMERDACKAVPRKKHVLGNATSNAAISPVDVSLQQQNAAAVSLWWSVSDSTLTLPTPTLHRQQRREVCLVITKHEEEGDGSTRRKQDPLQADSEVLALPF